MACALCELKAVKLFDDDAILVAEEKPVIEGHSIILPKQHYPILEQVPDGIVARLFTAAARMSVVAFDVFRASGTNIIVQNGIAAGQIIPHVVVNVIPRKEGDGLNFQWRATQLPDDRMAEIEARLRQQLEQLPFQQPEKEAEVIQETPMQQPSPQQAQLPRQPSAASPGDNYLIKQMERLP